jgi:branched-subunit amino acid transport protein
MDYSTFESWAAVALAVLATFFWRCLGLFFSDRIDPDGLIMNWINAVAYAMVTAVLMLILVFPTGILATTTLTSRLLGFALGVLTILSFKKLWLAIIVGLVVFAGSIYLGI